MLSSLYPLATLAVALFLLSRQASMAVWSICYALVALLYWTYGSPGHFMQILMVLIFIPMLICSFRPLRSQLVSKHLFKLVSKAMPAMSSTEREALEAGTVSWEGDIFSGAPDFDKLLKAPVVSLSAEEQAFMDGPVDELCRMLDEWDITHVRSDLPPDVWAFIKEKGFLGMIIPKEYGGLDLSATAQTMVLARVCGRSITAASTISVPNSLGPAELLLKYGTEQQKEYYLPRLADGREIPCFALTGPNAGSDAASIPDTGIVCRKTIDGKEVVGIRLNWSKRYITLCPVATVIGLAFRLFDPENILGKGEDVGISCALIPAKTKGVVTGRRHFPLNTGFLNGPTQGKDVFVPIDNLIGGAPMAGMGWRMLMECLSVGRSISLPSSAVGGSQAAALATGAYARVRKQFNQAIGHFEGIETPLARIAGNTYLMDAGLMLASSAIDQGEKPSVVGAILKYHTTERVRQVVIDAMDIHGGKGICLGPNNYLGRGYQTAPISITVEGANILTRNLIIFGQGAVRCHPYVYRELESVRANSLKDFDAAFWGHGGFVLANLVKSLVFNFTGARFTKAPASRVKHYYQMVHRYSSNMAFASDYCMMLLGGELKRREMLSARLGDVLSNLYLISAVLKRYHADGEPLNDLPVVDWCCQQLFYECGQALHGVIHNLPSRWTGILLKLVIQPFGNLQQPPSDSLCKKVAELMITPNDTRSRIARLAFKEPIANCPVGRLESAFNKLYAVEPLEKLVLKAVKKGKLHSLTFMDQIEEARKAGVLDEQQTARLLEAEKARQEVIAVDDFSNDELSRLNLDNKKVVSEKSRAKVDVE